MRRSVEASQCRHRQICLHFGEVPRWERCGQCDVCGVELRWLREPEKPASQPVRREPGPDAPQKRPAQAPPADEGLRVRLRAWRKEQSQQLRVPAYIVLHDGTIDALCRLRPASIGELLETPGIGERKAERFEEAILAVVRG